MAKTNTAAFAQDPKTALTVPVAAINLTGAGSIADTNNQVVGTSALLTSGNEGAIVTRLSCIPRGTNTAFTAFLFIEPAGSASGTRILIDSIPVAANTVSASVNSKRTDFVLANEVTPIRLGAGDKLHVGMSVALAVGVTFHAEYSNF